MKYILLTLMLLGLPSFGAQMPLAPFESMQQPQWPAKAHALRAKGVVKVKVEIDEQGNTTSHLESSNDQFGDVFLRETNIAVKHWRAEPGHPGTYHYKVTFEPGSPPEIQNQ